MPLMFAYGANLSRVRMSRICPGAHVIGRAVLPDHRLAFRTVADVDPCPGDRVQGIVWHLTERDLWLLGGYERDRYRLQRVTVLLDGDPTPVAVWREAGQLRHRDWRERWPLGSPPAPYTGLLFWLYSYWRFDEAPLRRALAEVGGPLPAQMDVSKLLALKPLM